MKYLKTYEKFEEQDLGRFGQNDNEEGSNIYGDDIDIDFDENEYINDDEINDIEDVNIEDIEDDEEIEDDDKFMNHERRHRSEDRKIWGDEVVVEKRRQAKPKDEKECCGKPSCKCKDKGDKKDDKKEDKKEAKGLTAAQKKLPEGLRKAILARQKK